MSNLTYSGTNEPDGKRIVWIKGEITTPPFSTEARREAGALLRQLQQGFSPTLPHSRPMTTVGKNCHELRITDRNANWRIVYRIETDAIVILDVFQKKTATTPQLVIEQSKARLARYLKTID